MQRRDSDGRAATVVSTPLISASVYSPSSWSLSDVSFTGRRSASFGVSMSVHHSDVRLRAC